MSRRKTFKILPRYTAKGKAIKIFIEMMKESKTTKNNSTKKK